MWSAVCLEEGLLGAEQRLRRNAPPGRRPLGMSWGRACGVAGFKLVVLK